MEQEQHNFEVRSHLARIDEAAVETSRRLGSGEEGYEYRPETIYGRIDLIYQTIERMDRRLSSLHTLTGLIAFAVVASVIRHW